MRRYSREDLERLRSSEFFQPDWYLEQYPEVADLGLDPAEHYLSMGGAMRRSPSAGFDARSYLEANPDVAESGQNPLMHFLKHGLAEQRTGWEPAPDPSEVERVLNSSTYPLNRPYAFRSAEELDAIARAYLEARPEGPARIAFYSAVTGGYDPVLYHEHLLPDAEYHVFTDSPVQIGSVTRKRRIPYYDIDPTRSARYVKLHPHTLLEGSRIAIWHDGNVLINGDLSALIDAFENSGLPVAAVPHPLRSSVYEEGSECRRLKKDDERAVGEQIERYRAEGFDCDDLIESNFMMFRLDHPRLAGFLDTWWSEVERGSRRDQLSFNYAAKKAGIEYFRLTEKPQSVRNHPCLALFPHGAAGPANRPSVTAERPREKCYADVRDERIANQKTRTADIVVCVHNALEVVDPCLRSVAANRDADRHRLIVVNDGSDGETSEWLRAFAGTNPGVELIHHPEARGYTRAANAGLRATSAEMGILLNSDTVVTGDWIDKMLDTAFSRPGVGIVGPLSNAASSQSIPDHQSKAGQTAINDLPPRRTIGDMDRWCERHSPADFVPLVPFVHGFCLGLTRETIETIGLFDEVNFPHGYGEENDYCLRAADAGIALAVATHTYVYHVKSQSYRDNERRTALMKSGNAKIRELHGEERVARLVRSFQRNPYLERLRTAARKLYPELREEAEAG